VVSGKPRHATSCCMSAQCHPMGIVSFEALLKRNFTSLTCTKQFKEVKRRLYTEFYGNTSIIIEESDINVSSFTLLGSERQSVWLLA
jgi:hypothetical protein